jgi:hypothetical protein
MVLNLHLGIRAAVIILRGEESEREHGRWIKRSSIALA